MANFLKPLALPKKSGGKSFNKDVQEDALLLYLALATNFRVVHEWGNNKVADYSL